jgi:hypothetical protein
MPYLQLSAEEQPEGVPRCPVKHHTHAVVYLYSRSGCGDPHFYQCPTGAFRFELEHRGDAKFKQRWPRPARGWEPVELTNEHVVGRDGVARPRWERGGDQYMEKLETDYLKPSRWQGTSSEEMGFNGD